MLVNKLGFGVLLLMLCRLPFCKSFQSDNYVYYDMNNSALDFLRVHSLNSGKVATTPMLKSVPLQFSPFILQITVSLHAYKTILAQSRRQK